MSKIAHRMPAAAGFRTLVIWANGTEHETSPVLYWGIGGSGEIYGIGPDGEGEEGLFSVKLDNSFEGPDGRRVERELLVLLRDGADRDFVTVDGITEETTPEAALARLRRINEGVVERRNSADGERGNRP